MTQDDPMVLGSSHEHGLTSVQGGFDRADAHEMVNHASTQHPWQLGGPCDLFIVDQSGQWIGDFSRNPKHEDTQRANARRAVACVNALAGVPTSWLEQFKPGDFLTALRYYGHAIDAEEGVYTDGATTEDVGGDDYMAVRRMAEMSQRLPLPEDVL